MPFKSVDEILDFAIGQEELAAKFYTELSDKVEKPWMKQVFIDFSKEEENHKKKLLGIKEGHYLEPSKDRILDLKISEYTNDVEPSPDMEYHEALILAMKAEKAAFKLYSNLAESVKEENLKNTFLALAQEEARHKLRFELEYDEYINQEN